MYQDSITVMASGKRFLSVKLSGVKLATFCVMLHKWKEPESDNVKLVRN